MKTREQLIVESIEVFKTHVARTEEALKKYSNVLFV